MVQNGSGSLEYQIRGGNIFMTITDFEMKLPVYLDRIGKWRNQYAIRRERGYHHYQWLQCTSGEGVVELNGKKHTLSQGQGTLLFPNEAHAYYAKIEPWEVHWFAFNGTSIDGMLQSLDIVQSLIVSFAAPDSIMQKLYRLTAIAETADPMKSILCSSIIYDLILDMHRCGGLLDSRSKQQYFEQLAPVLRYVEDQYYEPITLDLLASKLSVTPRHTCTLFQTALGLRPFEYVTMIRLRKAKELLMRRQELDVNEVARLVGYEHPSYFIRIFRKSEGVTPGQFRKSR